MQRAGGGGAVNITSLHDAPTERIWVTARRARRLATGTGKWQCGIDPVYGRVPAADNADARQLQDTITATISF